MIKFTAAAAIIGLISVPALAQTPDDAPSAWTGEGSLSAGSTTGNTETTDLGIGVKLAHDSGQWRQSGEFAADYGETDGLETRNRLFGGLQLDRKFTNPRWSAYGRATHEIDEFSGFDNRTFVGVGLGYQVIEGDRTAWHVEGGPGFKIDKIADQTVNNVVIPGSTEESFAVRAGSQFSHKFNEAVALSNDTNVVYADVSTQVNNTLALTAQLMNNLSARISYDVRHDTDPPLGVESTDTSTRLSLVYALGAK